MALVEIRNLVKRYNQTVAVDNVSLGIDEGEVFGLLGPNGAGKTTTIHMLCGLLRPDRGDIIVDGMKLNERPLEVKRLLGLVPQEVAVFDTLTAWENVAFFAKLSGLDGRLLKQRVEEALAFAGLGDRMHQVPKSFSGGMKRRLNIACALAHRPKLVIMDEPTVGIDPQSRNHILESVKELNRMGSTIIYTSHYMEEVEKVCTRIAIMDHGQLIAQGTKDELRRLVAHEEKIIIEVGDPNYNSVSEIKAINGIKEVGLNGTVLEILAVDAQLVLQDALFMLAKNDVRIRRIELVEPGLESLFLSLTGRKLRD